MKRSQTNGKGVHDPALREKLSFFVAACTLLSLIIFRYIFSGQLYWPKLPLYYGVYTLLWFILLNLHDFFSIGTLQRRSFGIITSFKCGFYALLFMLLARFFPKVTSDYMYVNLLKNGVVFLLFSFFTAAAAVAARMEKNKKAVILGSYETAAKLISELDAIGSKELEIEGIYTDDLPALPEHPVLGDESDCIAGLKKHAPAYVILTRERREEEKSAVLLDYAERHGIYLYYSDEVFERLAGKLPVRDMEKGYYFFLFRFIWENESALYRFVNRLFNIAAALAGLAVSVPVIMISAVIQQIDDRGPVFYTQKRVGENGREFGIFKMRTMRLHDVSEHPLNPMSADDPRITKFGRFMRRTRIDELPQFLNILAGDMNLVGPRPEQPALVAQYASVIPFYTQRHIVPPGITGWAQVNYDYGATVEDAEKKLQYDLYYVKNKSFWLDFEIAIKTFYTMIRGKGR